MGSVYESEGFLTAELVDPDGAATLREALRQPGSLSDEVARGGWCCRFYSRLSPADAYFLEQTLDLAVADDLEAQSLVAISLDFRPEVTLFLFALDEQGLYEVVLMPWEGSVADAETMLAAAVDALILVVGAIGWSPRAELRRFADEL
jgi:hypothetical protein